MWRSRRVPPGSKTEEDGKADPNAKSSVSLKTVQRGHSLPTDPSHRDLSPDFFNRIGQLRKMWRSLRLVTWSRLDGIRVCVLLQGPAGQILKALSEALLSDRPDPLAS